MKITFEMLPQFEILEIIQKGSVTKYLGVIKNIADLSDAEPEWIVTICVNQNKFIKGRISEIDSKTFHTVIDVNNSDFSSDLKVGIDYPLLCFWGDLVELVFSNSLVWKRVKFEPSDSTVNYPDGRVEIVKGGWEHEHCEICSQTISQYESHNNPYGYVSQKDNWLCESCYEKYVQAKSIDFVNLNQIF